MFEKQKQFAREHIVLTSTHHLAGGFGLALVLQHYLNGNSFLPVVFGWILIGFSLAVHLYEFIAPTKAIGKVRIARDE